MLYRIVILLCAFCPALANAYWDENWAFRTTVSVTETSATNLTNYQVLLTFSASDLHALYTWSADGRDLRILDSDDSTQLDYWIDSWDASTGTAKVWVRFPTLSAGAVRTIYLYYGNTSATAVMQAQPVFTYTGIKFHTRYNTTNTNSKAEAFSLFNAQSDNVTGYGCKFITDFTGISNHASFTNGSSINFIAYSQSYFYVDIAGTWYFRYGADFGYGGGLYVDGQTLEEQWYEDLWWDGSWPTYDGHHILYGSVYLSVGYHKLEIIGAENGNDGGITAQFCKPDGNCTNITKSNQQWQAFSTANIDIRSYACPVSEPVVSFGAHETRALDMALSAVAPAMWVVGAPRDLQLNLVNSGPQAASASTGLALTLGSQLVVDSISGSGWSCNGSSGSFSCSYDSAVAAGSSFSPLTLAIRAQSASVSSASYSAQLVTTQYDADATNNAVSATLAIRSLILPSGTACASPTAGLWTRFFNTQSNSFLYPYNAAQFQSMVDTFANETYLDGQTLRANVDGTGDPFDNRADEYYLTLFQGYLYVPSDGDWGLALDGDDATELWLDDVLRTGRYGGNSAGNFAQNWVSLGLAQGYHRFEFRHQEYQGQDSYYAYWRQGTSGTGAKIPGSAFVQCGGVFSLQLTATPTVVSDPLNGTSSPKSIPGAVIRYQVLAQNTGTLNSDSNTAELTQSVDATAELYIGDGSVSPVSFSDGSGNQSSGVTFTYPAGLSYSCDGGATYGCTPQTDGDGYASNVTGFRLQLDGSMKPQLGSLQPQFTYGYQVRLK